MKGNTTRITNVPSEQQAIRDKCFHPSGDFVEFPAEDLDKSIPERFDKIVRTFPDRLAVKVGGSSLTYDQLNKAANRIASAVLALRGESREPIGLLLNKSINLMAAILGVLKAGKFYVMIDSSLPPARISFIIEHSQATVVLTDDKHRAVAADLDKEGRQIINVDKIDPCVDCENPRLSISADDVAWIHYTSGSTGEPKGVTQSHRNAVHGVRAHTNSYHICPNDKILFLDSRGGDAFLALLNGAAAFPVDVKKEGFSYLAALLIQEQITVYGSVVSTFRYFVSTLGGAESFPKLRLVRLFGEPVFGSDVELCAKHFSDHCILENRLASSESPTVSRYFVDPFSPITDGPVPVGYPVEDIEIILLDETDYEVGIDQIGEIVVRSSFLSPGYWRQPDLTRTAFLSDPKGGGARLYRTRDLARRLPDGCLVHMGRKDFQIKIRGNRVEISEVETALLGFHNVKQSVVTSDVDSAGNLRLVGYVIPNREPIPTVSEIRSFLAKKLPDYMIPSAFVMMEKFPETGIGKVDRQALPHPGKSRPLLDAAYVTPSNDVEMKVVDIWSAVLAIDPIGIDDNFFDLGGHSLAATRVISNVVQTFRLDISIKVLFESPTVRRMAAVIEQHRACTASDDALERMLSEIETMSDAEAERTLAKGSALITGKAQHE